MIDMTTLIKYILQTKKLGSTLISSKYNDSEFADYLLNIDIIIKCIDSLTIKNAITERTIELMKRSSPDNYRLNGLMKIYYALMAPRLTQGILLINNSSEQINKRFIFETNSRLSILEKSKKIRTSANK